MNEIPTNLSDYLASEKLDGVRCVWTGSEFVSRHGKIFKAPDWLKAGMPACRLDGELYMGRDTFARLQSVMQRKGSDWVGIKFHVFDLAEMRLTTEERICKLATISLPAHCELIPHQVVTHADLDALEADIVNAGGEGVCLRHRSEMYRPNNYIKVKRLFPDLERWQG